MPLPHRSLSGSLPRLLAASLLLTTAGASRSGFTLVQQWKGVGRAPLAVSPDGALIAVTLPDRPQQQGGRLNIAVYDTRRWKQLYRAMSANNIDAPALTFSPDSRTLWSAHTGTVRYEARSGKLLEMNVGSDGPGIAALAFSGAGRSYALTVVNTVNDYGLWLIDTWSKASGWRGTPYPPTPAEHQPSNWIRSLAFSPDGKWLASGSGGGGIVLREARTGRRLGHLSDPPEPMTRAMKAGWTAHAQAVTALAFVSPARLVSASRNGEVKLWDTRTWKVLSQLRLRGGLNALRLTPTGQVLAAAGEGLVRIGTRGGHLKRQETLFGAQDPPTDVGVTADGRTAWTISRRGTLTRILLSALP